MKIDNSRPQFYYQLQKYDTVFTETIKKSQNSVWVIDLYKNKNEMFTTFDVLSFKNKNNKILSYLSLGEAEDYRKYYTEIPKDLVLYENKNWKGNFVIKYWDSIWHEIIYGKDKSLINKIIEQAFDGVFLDVVDVFKRFDDTKEHAIKMAELIIALSEKAKAIKPDFVVNIQNGFDIIESLSGPLKNKFLSSVDGLSIEAHFFNYTKDGTVKNPWFEPLEKIIDEYRKLGKRLYMIEYVKKPDQIAMVRDYCDKNNISLLITTKALDGNLNP